MCLSELQVRDSITYKVEDHTFFIAGDTQIEKGKGKGKHTKAKGTGNRKGTCWEK